MAAAAVVPIAALAVPALVAPGVAAAAVAPANLTVSMGQTPADGSMVTLGDQITYTILLSNSGGTAATPITVRNPIPAGTTYVAGSADNGGKLTTKGEVKWTQLDVPAAGEGGPGTLQLSFAVTVMSTDAQAQVLQNLAGVIATSAICGGQDSCTTNTVKATVGFPQVVATKSQSPADGATVSRGEKITYTLSLTNSGLLDASNVTVTDTVPAGTTFSSATGGGTESKGVVTWTVKTVPAGKLAAGSSSVTPGTPVTVTFTVTVNSTDTNGQSITNTASYANVHNPSSACTGHATCPTNTVKAAVKVVPVASTTTTSTTSTTVKATATTTATTTKKAALAFTGSSAPATIGLGLLLGLSGAALVAVSRRKPRGEG